VTTASVLSIVLAVVGGFALGAGVGLTYRARRPSPAHSTVPASPLDDGADAQIGGAGAQRARLAAALIDLRDRLESDALDAEISAALASSGFREVTVAPGSPFDPEQHRGVDWEPTHDPEHDKLVAHTDRPGYVDGTTVLRPPEVVVYRLADQTTTAP